MIQMLYHTLCLILAGHATATFYPETQIYNRNGMKAKNMDVQVSSRNNNLQHAELYGHLRDHVGEHELLEKQDTDRGRMHEHYQTQNGEKKNMYEHKREQADYYDRIFGHKLRQNIPEGEGYKYSDNREYGHKLAYNYERGYGKEHKIDYEHDKGQDNFKGLKLYTDISQIGQRDKYEHYRSHEDNTQEKDKEQNLRNESTADSGSNSNDQILKQKSRADATRNLELAGSVAQVLPLLHHQKHSSSYHGDLKLIAKKEQRDESENLHFNGRDHDAKQDSHEQHRNQDRDESKNDQEQTKQESSESGAESKILKNDKEYQIRYKIIKPHQGEDDPFYRYVEEVLKQSHS